MGQQSRLRAQRKLARKQGMNMQGVMPHVRVGGKPKTKITALQFLRDQAVRRAFKDYEAKKLQAYEAFTRAVLGLK